MSTTARREIRWARRVPKWKIRRLYQLDAQGIIDEELIDDVGTILLERCRSILTIQEAQQGRVRCPRCTRQRQVTIIERSWKKGDVRDEVLTCPKCGWDITWGEYQKSFKRKQLNPGGAVAYFEAYINDYRAARSPGRKMLAIDRLIHAFHFSMTDRPELPTRPAGVNLIEGKLTDVIQFLDGLSSGEMTQPELLAARSEWESNLEDMREFWGRPDFGR